MCPACLATAAAWWIAGAGSSGGLLAFVAKRRPPKPVASAAVPTAPSESTESNTPESGEVHASPERRCCK